jgi:hypothetical protein
MCAVKIHTNGYHTDQNFFEFYYLKTDIFSLHVAQRLSCFVQEKKLFVKIFFQDVYERLAPKAILLVILE